AGRGVAGQRARAGAGAARRDGLARGIGLAVDPLQERERGATDRAPTRTRALHRSLVQLLRLCAITLEREHLRETGERVLAFVEAQGVLRGGDRLVEPAGGGERGGVDADRVGLAGECVTVERADAQRFGGLVEIEQ